MAIKPIELIIRAKDEASSVFGSMQSKVAAVGAAIAGYFGVQAFAGAVKGAADLEAALSEVRAVSGGTADEMVRLRAAAEAAGSNTQYTATEAATALGNLARAGLSASQAIDALPATLQLAAAGGIALEQSSTIVTRTLAGFTLEATEAGRVADVLAMGANASNTSVQGLGEALSYAAPIAKSVGLSLEGTVAIIGKFADAGIDASRAGTALNAILGQFADPASKFKTELSAIGITTNNFEDALNQLAAAGPKGENAIRAVGMEAGPAMRGLLNQGIGALTELRTKLQESGGSAEATAKTMQDNLNGSIKGLGSAWDTLKNALATPVLPVLKSGVDSLATSFRDAVESGVVAKFGAAIATGFESALAWAKQFLAQVDFAAMGEAMRGYAARASEAFNTIKNAATTAGDVVRLVWGTMSAGTNAVLSAVYAVGGVFTTMVAQIQSGLALLNDGFAKVTFGKLSADFKASAEIIRQSADATNAAAAALEQKAIDAFGAMADGAQTARNGWTGLTTDSTAAASTLTGAVSPALAKTAADLQAMGGKAAEAGTKAAGSAADQAAATAAAQAKVTELRAEYEKAVASGNWQLAAEKMVELRQAADGAKDGIGDLEKKAKEKADAIAAAFAGMGIKTKDQLQNLANTAKERFDLIKDSGQATADGLATAWKQMADAAIAANGGVATETLKVEASMYGLRIETDKTGKSIVRAMGEGSDATQGFANALKDTRTELEKLNDERERGIRAPEKANELKERENALYREKWNIDKQNRVLDSDGKVLEQFMGYDRAGLVKRGQEAGLDEASASKLFDRLVKDQNGLVKPFYGEEEVRKAADKAIQDRAREGDFNDALDDAKRTGKLSNNLNAFSPAQQDILRDAAAKSPVNQERDKAKTATRTSLAAKEQPTDPRQRLEQQAVEALRAGDLAGADRLNMQAAQEARAQASTPAKTYNVTINGTTVRTASDADAQTLLRVLQNAKLSA